MSVPAAPPLTTGITGAFNLLPPSLFVDAAALQPAQVPSVTYNKAVSQMNQEARAAVADAAVRGELTVPSDITEEQLEEMEVDQQLRRDAVDALKRRLSIKIREQEALEARLRVARKAVAARKKKIKDERMAAMRTKRAALMRQQSEDTARAAPPTDLTTEGIEPNPGPTVDDLFRVFLIPRASPPVELFINVPDEELDDFPRVPSIQALCGPSIVKLHDGLLLVGALPQLAECSARFGINENLAPLLSSLVPTGSYLLVHNDGNLPESITVATVLSALKLDAAWEEAFIAEHELESDTFVVEFEQEPEEPEPDWAHPLANHKKALRSLREAAGELELAVGALPTGELNFGMNEFKTSEVIKATIQEFKSVKENVLYVTVAVMTPNTSDPSSSSLIPMPPLPTALRSFSLVPS